MTGAVLRDDHRITTDRLLLTPFHHVDQGALLDVFQNPDVRRYLLDDALVDAACNDPYRHRYKQRM